jgi:hypothetical protein
MATSNTEYNLTLRTPLTDTDTDTATDQTRTRLFTPGPDPPKKTMLLREAENRAVLDNCKQMSLIVASENI